MLLDETQVHLKAVSHAWVNRGKEVLMDAEEP
jgi:hypothetical protein